MKKQGAGEFGIPLDASLRSYDSGEVSAKLATDTGPETLVQQHFADEVDVNTIVRRFGLTRELPIGVAGGVYGDFSGISDYESALEQIERARAGFMALPAPVRERFNNNPGELIKYAQSVSLEEFERSMAPPPSLGGVTPPVVSDS